MIDRFESALWKVDRARKHADDLEIEVRAFWDTDPYEVEMVGTPLTGLGFFRVRRIARRAGEHLAPRRRCCP